MTLTTAVEPVLAPPTTPRRRSGGGGRGQTLAAFFFLLPWLLGMVLFTFGPMLYSLYLSFTRYDLLSSPEWVGLANYAAMGDDPRFWKSVTVTLTYVVVFVPLLQVVAMLVALLLNSRLRFLTGYRALFYLPSLMGASVAIAALWRQVFGADGLVNSVAALFGIEGVGSWVGDPDRALGTIITLNLWAFGSTMIIFLAGLRQVPRELLEAAEVDGASKVRRFFSITLPLMTPLVFFNVLMGTINAFQSFTGAYVVSGGTGGPVDSTLFYTLYLYERGFTQLQMGYASAMAWLLLIALAVVTAVFFRSSRYWVHYGDES
ncbi:carbohydrate ABC transporter permease [Auraticoccus monumenti]|uniref:Multiple sugar transport system permease protein n=1 Tax=Auraticoccus monumenti TaxID=675864 RepID=A0A1G6VEF1_9ACTN|nr:sugar ABC transporter permease [Auraticoccus monumenti]SDD51763.1 multiple sugar transport system permease protein [Auraticoccus monumenti]